MVLVYFAHWMGSVGLSLSGFCLQGQVLFGGGSSFHSGIEARPPKQPRMVRTFLQVHTLSRLAYALWCRGY
jgi:hypothetical protein